MCGGPSARHIRMVQLNVGPTITMLCGWIVHTRPSIEWRPSCVVPIMATIHAAEESAWLLLACSPDKRLTVSLIHAGRFSFSLKPSSSVQLRSNNVPTFSIEGKTVASNLIFVDPRPLRHIMPVIVQDDQLVASIPEQNGTMHDYTFSIQSNDLALRPFRSGCFDF